MIRVRYHPGHQRSAGAAPFRRGRGAAKVGNRLPVCHDAAAGVCPQGDDLSLSGRRQVAAG